MSTIRTSDGLVISTSEILRDPTAWSPAFVSAAKMAEQTDAIRARSGAQPKVVTVGISNQEHAHAQ